MITTTLISMMVVSFYFKNKLVIEHINSTRRLDHPLVSSPHVSLAHTAWMVPSTDDGSWRESVMPSFNVV